jgi:hypothetical protein
VNVFDDVVVCLPTVPSRAAVLAETLAQWARLGVTPLVETQPADWPLGGPSQRRNAERALRRALDERPDVSHVLFTEDDVDLAPDLPAWLPAMRWLDAPVTLFVPLLRHYPPAIRRQIQRGQPLTEGLVPNEHLDGWWGTQAVLLPRRLVEDVLCWESGRHGWDAHLQHYLETHGLTLYVTVPNLVQQRPVRTLMTESADGGQHRSQTFGLPSTGGAISPPEPGAGLERASALAGR